MTTPEDVLAAREALVRVLAQVGIVEDDRDEQYRFDYVTTDRLLRELAAAGWTLSKSEPDRRIAELQADLDACMALARAAPPPEPPALREAARTVRDVAEWSRQNGDPLFRDETVAALAREPVPPE